MKPQVEIQSRSRRRFIAGTASGLLGTVLWQVATAQEPRSADVCVYGGTASGVMAAVAAAREGARVLLIEPSRWLGGMTGGGLTHIDWGRKEAVGGSTRGILEQGLKDPQYRSTFARMLEEHQIPVIFEHRISAVEKEGPILRALRFDFAPHDALGCPAGDPAKPEALRVTASVFIDCTYEGDLMARAGVSHTFGRESRDTYGESLAGSQELLSVYPIDPYRIPGTPRSGLLPLLQDLPHLREGSADQLTMGYGFRWKFSKAANRIPIEPPEDDDPARYELFRRGFQGGVDMFTGRQMKYTIGQWQPTRTGFYTYGSGNLSRTLWAPTNYGSNTDYPNGNYRTRSQIWRDQIRYLQGMTHFMRTDPVVPEKWRTLANEVGLEPGIFDDTKGYPHQLYVREARRMRSRVVITQADLAEDRSRGDSVGLASYGVDEWPYATIPFKGQIALQGGYLSELWLNEKTRGIYQIPYSALTPLQSECQNLLVPVCVSASHIAMTSIRMEPVWMILGESAGVAAALAARENIAVQEVRYPDLRAKLVALGQRLERPTSVEKA
jgi:hypothetical protein